MKISGQLQKLDLKALRRFLAGGVLSSGVTLTVTAFLHELVAVPEPVAAAFGLTMALGVNFVVLRYFVFQGTRMPPGQQLLVFLGSSGVFRGIEYAGFFALHLVNVHYLIALVLVLGLSFVLKFLVYEKLVFARKPSVESQIARHPPLDPR